MKRHIRRVIEAIKAGVAPLELKDEMDALTEDRCDPDARDAVRKMVAEIAVRETEKVH